MIVIYSDQKFIPAQNSIFLAGPTPRVKGVKSWRKEALKFLRKAGFQGVVYVPEYSTGKPLEEYSSSMTNFNKQVEWEEAALKAAGAILFWIPRKMDTMPALTTNVEFGMHYKEKRAFLGHPSDAVHMDYMDRKYRMRHPDRTIPTDLKSLCGLCVKYVQDKSVPQRVVSVFVDFVRFTDYTLTKHKST